MERTFVMIKPDGVRRKLVGEVIRRFEDAGLKICALKLINMTYEQATSLYAVHKDKPFFRELVDFVLSGPVVVMVLSGEKAVAKVREIMGATNPKDALPGTIRGDLATEITENIVHGADSSKNAKREISLFFKGEEIIAE